LRRLVLELKHESIPYSTTVLMDLSTDIFLQSQKFIFGSDSQRIGWDWGEYLDNSGKNIQLLAALDDLESFGNYVSAEMCGTFERPAIRMQMDVAQDLLRNYFFPTELDKEFVLNGNLYIANINRTNFMISARWREFLQKFIKETKEYDDTIIIDYDTLTMSHKLTGTLSAIKTIPFV